MKLNFIPIQKDLYLTEVKENDSIFFLKYLNDLDITENTLTIPYPYYEQDAKNFIAFCRTQEQKYEGALSCWAIRNERGELIGGIGRFMHTGAVGHFDEIGYWLGAPFRNRGIMSLVLNELCNQLFEHTNLVRIEALVFEGNINSVKTLKKAGFEQEGFLKKRILKNGRLKNALLFAKTKP